MALNALITRRTIRQYDPEYIIPKEYVQAIMEAAILSPTSKDIQDIDLLAVTSREKIEKVSKITLDSIDDDGRGKFMKRIENFKVKNPITGDAGCLFCLLRNERATEPEKTLVHEGIFQMAIMVAAREFGLHSMALGCMKQADKASLEKELGITPGSFLIGVVVGKAVDKPFFIDKKRLNKCYYLK